MKAKFIHEAFERKSKEERMKVLLFPGEEKLRNLYNSNYHGTWGDLDSANRGLEPVLTNLIKDKGDTILYVNFQNLTDNVLEDKDYSYSLNPSSLNDIDTIAKYVKELLNETFKYS